MLNMPQTTPNNGKLRQTKGFIIKLRAIFLCLRQKLREIWAKNSREFGRPFVKGWFSRRRRYKKCFPIGENLTFYVFDPTALDMSTFDVSFNPQHTGPVDPLVSKYNYMTYTGITITPPTDYMKITNVS